MNVEMAWMIYSKILRTPRQYIYKNVFSLVPKNNKMRVIYTISYVAKVCIFLSIDQFYLCFMSDRSKKHVSKYHIKKARKIN